MPMAGAKGRITVGHRILMGFDGYVEPSGAAAAAATGTLNDMVFGCFEEEEAGSAGSCCNEFEEDDDDEAGSPENIAQSKAFWNDQHQLVHETLSRTSSLESRIRQVTKEALNEFQSSGRTCACDREAIRVCRNCAMRRIRDRLQDAGYNSAICKTKWRRSPDIPAGEHTHVDVVEKSSSKKGDSRVVIELGFRAEFEMARASEEYNKLINRLPEVFVGRSDRLRVLIKILCSAAKKCMKENKMHMGPWRKHKYMQAKWFGTRERTVSDACLPLGFSDRLMKPKASMLTFDSADKLPRLQHLTAAVAVV